MLDRAGTIKEHRAAAPDSSSAQHEKQSPAGSGIGQEDYTPVRPAARRAFCLFSTP